MTIKKFDFTYAIALFFIFSNVFDMPGRLGIKYISTIIVFLLPFLNVKFKLGLFEILVLFYLVVILPLNSILIASLRNVEEILYFALSPLFLTLPAIVILTKYIESKVLIDFFFKSILFIAFFVLLLNFSSVFFGRSFVSEYYLPVIFDNVDIYGGRREQALVPFLYHRAALFFVPCFIYFFFKGSFVNLLIIFPATILSVSKSGVILILIFLFLYFLYKSLPKFILINSIFVFIFLNFVPDFYQQLIYFHLSGDSETVSTRYSDFADLLVLFSNDILGFLFGFGPGSSFFSSAHHSFVYNIEIDHFEIVRRYGILPLLPVFLSFVLIMFVSVFSYRSKFNLSIAWFFCLIAVGTNPVLVSPPFIIFTTLFFKEVFKKP